MNASWFTSFDSPNCVCEDSWVKGTKEVGMCRIVSVSFHFIQVDRVLVLEFGIVM